MKYQGMINRNLVGKFSAETIEVYSWLSSTTELEQKHHWVQTKTVSCFWFGWLASKLHIWLGWGGECLWWARTVVAHHKHPNVALIMLFWTAVWVGFIERGMLVKDSGVALSKGERHLDESDELRAQIRKQLKQPCRVPQMFTHSHPRLALLFF